MIIRIIIFMMVLFPAIIIDGLIYIFGGWTLPWYRRKSVVMDLLDWVDGK